MEFGLLEPGIVSALGVVSRSRRWKSEDLLKVAKKLVATNMTRTRKLLIAIKSGMLNPVLKQNGFTSFSKKTLSLLYGILCCTCIRDVEIIESTNVIEIREEHVEEPPPPAVEDVIDESEVQTLMEGCAEISGIISPDSLPTVIEGKMIDADSLQPIRELAEWHIIEIPIKHLYFYQTSVAGTFSDSRSLQSTVNELRMGEKTPYKIPLMHTLLVDGRLYGMGTRRTVCYHRICAHNQNAMIPVLFANRSSDSSLHNKEGLNMCLIHPCVIDGVTYHEMSRSPHSPDIYSCKDLTKQYENNVLPVKREGSTEYWHPYPSTPWVA